MKTLDYTKFKPILGNREVHAAHVQNLVVAIERKNLLKHFPLLINEKDEVIDGQHRLAAAMELGVEIYYDVVPGLVIEDVMEINTNSRGWTIYDFINSWAKLDKPDYVELKAFIEQYGLIASVAGQLLHGWNQSAQVALKNGQRIISGGGRISESIRTGKFTVNTPKRARQVAELLQEVAPFCDFPAKSSYSFVSAVRLMFNVPGFDPERLISKLRNNSLVVTRRVSDKYYLLELEEFYNFHVKTEANFLELYKSAQRLSGTVEAF